MCCGEGELCHFCENNHFIHTSCLQAFCKSRYPDTPECPLCRSNSVKLVVRSLTLPEDLLSKSPFSYHAAIVAVVAGYFSLSTSS
jgi:hypothetical protein